MNKSIFPVLLIALWSQACNTSSTKSPKNEQSSVSVENKRLMAGEEGKTCFIDLQYEWANSGPEKTQATINAIIDENLKELLRNGTDSAFTAPSVQDFANNALQNCKKINDEYYMMDLRADYKIKSGKDGYITISMFNEAFTGGAHPNHSTIMKVVSEKTGELLSLAQIFKDTAALTRLCESQFRQDFKIEPKAGINTPGLWFENDKFTLNDNFGFINDTLLFWYNPYEIASYAAGDIILKIKPEDWKKLKK